VNSNEAKRGIFDEIRLMPSNNFGNSFVRDNSSVLNSVVKCR